MSPGHVAQPPFCLALLKGSVAGGKLPLVVGAVEQAERTFVFLRLGRVGGASHFFCTGNSEPDGRCLFASMQTRCGACHVSEVLSSPAT